MVSILRLTTLILALAAGDAVTAGDPVTGKSKAVTCVACHGPEGLSPNDLWPNLAGQKEAYMIKQIKAFKDGSRIEPLMAPMVAPLSDTDVEDVAAYFSSLERTK
jgi:cytochrome c553